MSNRRSLRRGTPANGARNSQVADPVSHQLVFVVSADGKPHLFVHHEVSAEQAADLLELMAKSIREDPRWRERGEV